MPHAALTATAPAGPAALFPPPSPAAKPRGNPNLHLAPRCGARTRAGCPCRSPAIHGKLRCRMHGGRSPGPRTPEGRIRVRDARTIHGDYGASTRAKNRFRITLLRLTRVDIALELYKAHLPPVFAARARGYPPELMPPPRPSGGITAAEDRAMRHAAAASLAPWCGAIAEARAAHRAAAAAARPATAQTKPSAAKPNTPARSRRRARPSSPLETLLALFAANRHALDRMASAPGTAPFALPSPGLPEPHAPVRAGDAHVAGRHAPSGHAPSLGLSEPHAPVDPRSPAPSPPAVASLLTALDANLHALECVADRRLAATVASPGHAEPLAPVAARTRRSEPIAPDPAPPLPLDRAARRRLKCLQRRHDRAAR
jgi:hypothetical protein